MKGFFYDLGDKFCSPNVGNKELCFNNDEIRAIKETVIRIESEKSTEAYNAQPKSFVDCSQFILSTYRGKSDFLNCTNYWYLRR